MKGLLDNMFDFDHDGKLGFFERAAKRQFINNMMEDDKKKPESDAYQYSSGSADYDRTELEMSGLDPEELEFMDPEERRETLEDAGLDPDEYDF